MPQSPNPGSNPPISKQIHDEYRGKIHRAAAPRRAMNSTGRASYSSIRHRQSQDQSPSITTRNSSPYKPDRPIRRSAKQELPGKARTSVAAVRYVHRKIRESVHRHAGTPYCVHAELQGAGQDAIPLPDSAEKSVEDFSSVFFVNCFSKSVDSIRGLGFGVWRTSNSGCVSGDWAIDPCSYRASKSLTWMAVSDPGQRNTKTMDGDGLKRRYASLCCILVNFVFDACFATMLKLRAFLPR